jgi:hypothetical protein
MNVGITGHREIGASRIIEWVYTEIGKAVYEYNVSNGFTCLAVGADQIFARVLLNEKIPYVAIIPCERYETTFELADDYEGYKTLVNQAIEKKKLNFLEPSDQAFFEAGKCVVNYSDLMFAVWDGEPVEGLGGTADVVEYALSKRKRVLHINPATRHVAII